MGVHGLQVCKIRPVDQKIKEAEEMIDQWQNVKKDVAQSCIHVVQNYSPFVE